MSSFFKRHRTDEPDTDEENDDGIDPELRLRTVRTAASAIAESIKSEQRAEKRRSRSKFFRRHHSSAHQAAEKKAEQQQQQQTQNANVSSPSLKVPGARRNIYVNHPLSAMEVDHDGEPKARYVRNKVRTTSECFLFFTRLLCGSNIFEEYTIITFIPKNLYEQFRR